MRSLSFPPRLFSSFFRQLLLTNEFVRQPRSRQAAVWVIARRKRVWEMTRRTAIWLMVAGIAAAFAAAGHSYAVGVSSLLQPEAGDRSGASPRSRTTPGQASETSALPVAGHTPHSSMSAAAGSMSASGDASLLGMPVRSHDSMFAESSFANALLVDHPCNPNPVFPSNCVSQLGAIGDPPAASANEGFLNIAAPVVDPILLLESADANNGLLYVLNPAANKVRVLNPAAGLALVQDIPVCYRPSALAQSPDGSQVFVSCHASHAIAVIETGRNRVVAEIQDRDAEGRPRLQEPMGMAVSGNTLYVASSQNNRIAVIDLTTRRVLRYIAIPGQDPRDLAITPDGQFLIVANFLAGNRTEPVMSFNGAVLNPGNPAGAVCAPILSDPSALNVALETSPTFMDTSHPQYPTIAECYFFAHTFGSTGSIAVNPAREDHDLVVVRAADGQVVFTTDSLSQDIGTINYGLSIDPLTLRVYVATVHARNFLNSSFGNRPLINRLAVLSLNGATGALSVTSIQDLDDPFLDDAGVGTALAATPHAVLRSGDRVLIAAAGSDRLVVANAAGTITDTIPVGFTPKGVAAAGNTAYVYNATGLTVSKVDLAGAAQVATASIGSSALGQTERIGEHLFNSAQFASNRTFACASCHPDGHLDGLVWRLNDVDGLRSTMTIQEISETEPYHWDGSKCNLVKILQDGITNLFLNPAGPTQCEMKTMIDYMTGLVRPNSPFRAADDRMTYPAKLGLVIAHRGRFKELDDDARSCSGRPQDPAVETAYLAEIGDPHNTTFAFNGGGGPFPNTLVAESCGVSNCHVSPHWESDGFVNGNPNGGLIDGFQAVSTLGTWDRMVTMHDARTTRAKFAQAMRVNRAFHGAPVVDTADNYTGKLATHGFNDSFFRHVEFNFDGNSATHAWALSDSLTSFDMEEEELQCGAVGLTAVLTRANASDALIVDRLAILQSSANQGKIAWLGMGTLGGAPASVVWQPGSSTFLRDDGSTLTLAELKSSLLVGDTMMLYGALAPSQSSVPRPKLKAVMRSTSPILCSEAYADYHANVLAGEAGAVLALHATDVTPGSRVLVDGQAVGLPLSSSGAIQTWVLPQAPAAPTILSVQVLSPAGLQSNSIPVPVVAPVVAAFEPSDVEVAKPQPALAALDWTNQFGVTGPGTRYDVFGGTVSQLRASGFASGACLTPQSLFVAALLDGPMPAPGDARYYVVRAQNQVNVTTWGSPARDAGIAASPSPCSTLYP